MKKIISCVLVLAMFLSLGIGSALAGVPTEPVGSYELTNLIMEGEDYTEILKSADVVFTLELREDGTGVLVQGDDVLNLTWDAENIYADDGIPVPYTYEDGVLVMEDSDMTMTFTKTDKLDTKGPEAGDDRGIVDLWVGTIDIKPFIEEAEPELGALLESAPMSITMEMREDGSYLMSLDASPMLPALRAAMYGYIEQLCKDNGISVEDYEESTGKTLEETVDEALEAFDLNDINQTVEGVYEEANGQVIWDKGAGETRGLYTGDTLVFSLESFGEVVLTRAGIYGIWVAEIDLLTFLGEEDEEMAGLLDGITAQITLELRSDESFILSLDAEALIPALRMALLGYFEQVLEESGMSAEDFEKMTGMSLEATVDAALTELDAGEMGAALAGTWEQKDDQLILKADNSKEETATLQGGKLTFSTDEYGDLCFLHVINEDVLAKGEGVMSYAEYAAAQTDDEVVIEAYVLDHQSWWDDKISVYAQDADGAYFIYNMACSEEDAELLVPGQKIRVTGFKSEWAGEVEITDASFEFLRGSYSFKPVDITEAWGTVDMIQYQNQLVSFRGAKVEPYDETGAAFVYKDPDGKTDDLYFKVTIGDTTYEFCVEYYLRGSDTEVYKTVEGLHVGDVIDLKGYLYWYEGPNLHTIGVTVRESAED